jgi:putative GTP pyrophosphokinase
MSHNKEYHLNPHGLELMQQYKDRLPIFQRMETLAFDALQQALSQQGLYVTSIEHRIKKENSLAGKLELKGNKYNSLSDITDILGIRIITFYTDDVDKVAAIVQQIFKIDWEESVDKRKRHELTSFGYNSLHYICRLPKTLVNDPAMPELNEYRFELQMRTALQHVCQVSIVDSLADWQERWN